MVYIPSGIKATQLIEKLREMVEKHGDLECFAGGGDYPEGIDRVSYRPRDRGDGYIPGNSFVIG